MTPRIADIGLLLTVFALRRERDTPATGAAVSAAAGIPAEYADIVQERLERLSEGGFAVQRPDRSWSLTTEGLALIAAARRRSN